MPKACAHKGLRRIAGNSLCVSAHSNENSDSLWKQRMAAASLILHYATAYKSCSANIASLSASRSFPLGIIRYDATQQMRFSNSTSGEQ
jgi:hypothetical protein